MRTVFFTVFILMSAIVMKAYDLVVALTGGGPGFSSDFEAKGFASFLFTSITGSPKRIRTDDARVRAEVSSPPFDATGT